MRLYRLILVTFLLAPAAHSYAQDTPDFRLRVPSAQEYLETVIAITDQLSAQTSGSSSDNRLFYREISNILWGRYPNLFEQDFDLLAAVYQGSYIGEERVADRGEWNKLLIHSWLFHHPVDLSTVNELRFADFHITVSSYDFDGDGAVEHVLDTAKGAEPAFDRLSCRYDVEVADYLVVKQLHGEYQFIPTPLSWHGDAFNRMAPGTGGILELQVEDLNYDHLPEWVLVDGGYIGGGPGMGYNNAGQLYVLGWRDGALINLLPPHDYTPRNRDKTASYQEAAGVCHGPIPRDVIWEFINIDNDSPLEILQHQRFLDNWYCGIQQTKTFDWNAAVDRYVFTSMKEVFPQDTQNCSQRQAEEAMWTGNYPDAIRRYERALTLERFDYLAYWELTDPATPPDVEQTLDGLNQYLRARLALAHLLNKQPDEAHHILSQLAVENLDSTMQYFVDALSEAGSDPLAVCFAAYDVFTGHFPTHHLGYIGDYLDGDYHEYQPERVGCDAGEMLRKTLIDHVFDQRHSPRDHIEELGLSIERSLKADLDGDGLDEWLIWLDSKLNPIFFTPVGDVYRISFPAVDPYGKSEGVQIWRLPGEAGFAVAYLNYDYWVDEPPWFQVYDPVAGRGGAVRCVDEENGHEVGTLRLWHVVEHELQPMLGVNVCEYDLYDVFPEGEGSWILIGREGVLDEQEGFVAEPVVYTWDDEAQNYQRPSEPEAALTPSIHTGRPYYTAWDAFHHRDYVMALEMIDEAFPTIPQLDDIDHDNILSYRYLRGLSLEALGRYDEALTAYVTVYETGPDSVWAILAQSHLERVKN